MAKKEDIEAVKNRYDYLDLYLYLLEQTHKEIQNFINEYGVPEDEEGYPEDLAKIEAEIDYVNKERQKGFFAKLGRPPRWWYAREYPDNSLPNEGIYTEGERVFYTYVRDSTNESVHIDITHVYEPDRPLYASKIINNSERMPLQQAIDLLTLEGVSLRDKTLPEQYDLISFNDSSILHYVHKRLDGSLEIVRLPVISVPLYEGGYFQMRALIVPMEALEMLKRVQIHTAKDLALLYRDDGVLTGDITRLHDYNQEILFIPSSETAYRQMKPGYYHLSRA